MNLFFTNPKPIAAYKEVLLAFCHNNLIAIAIHFIKIIDTPLIIDSYETVQLLKNPYQRLETKPPGFIEPIMQSCLKGKPLG